MPKGQSQKTNKKPVLFEKSPIQQPDVKMDKTLQIHEKEIEQYLADLNEFIDGEQDPELKVNFFEKRFKMRLEQLKFYNARRAKSG